MNKPLIPNSATATVRNVGINCPLEYLQVLATTFVSLLFIYALLTKFSLYFFLNAFCNNYGWLVRPSRINYWNAHKPVCFVLNFLLSVTQNIHVSKEQHKKHLCNQSSHYEKYRRFTCEMSAHILILYVKAIFNFSNVELVS